MWLAVFAGVVAINDSLSAIHRASPLLRSSALQLLTDLEQEKQDILAILDNCPPPDDAKCDPVKDIVNSIQLQNQFDNVSQRRRHGE